MPFLLPHALLRAPYKDFRALYLHGLSPVASRKREHFLSLHTMLLHSVFAHFILLKFANNPCE